MDSLPQNLRAAVRNSSLSADFKDFEKSALDAAEFLANVLKSSRNEKRSKEKRNKRLEEIMLCIYRMLMLCDSPESLNLKAALLSVYLDSFCCKRLLFNQLEQTEVESLCTICFSFLKGSVGHVLDVLLQAECLGSNDWSLVQPILRKISASKELLRPTLVVYLKFLVTGLTITSLFPANGKALVNSILHSVQVPEGLAEYMKRQGFQWALGKTGIDLFSDLTEDRCNQILDSFSSDQRVEEEKTDTMLSLEASGNITDPLDLLYGINKLEEKPLSSSGSETENEIDAESEPDTHEMAKDSLGGLFQIDTLPSYPSPIENTEDPINMENDMSPHIQDDLALTQGLESKCFDPVSVSVPLERLNSPEVKRLTKTSEDEDNQESNRVSDGEPSALKKSPRKRSSASSVELVVTRSRSKKTEKKRAPKKTVKKTVPEMKDKPKPNTDPTPPLKMRLRHSRLNISEQNSQPTKKTRTLPSADPEKKLPAKSKKAKARTKN